MNEGLYGKLLFNARKNENMTVIDHQVNPIQPKSDKRPNEISQTG